MATVLVPTGRAARLLTLHALVIGGDCIDDADVLRTGFTAAVLGHRVMASSTLGTFLRSFTFGHIRQLDRVAETILGRAWAAGATRRWAYDHRPGLHRLWGPRPPQGRRRLRLHPGAWLSPLLATRADTGEVLHARQRTGRAASGRGAERFVNETGGRIRCAGASGPLQLCTAACRAVGEHWDFGDDRA